LPPDRGAGQQRGDAMIRPMPANATLSTQALALYSAAMLALLALSGWHAYESATWVMEVAPAFIVLGTLWVTRQRFPLTPLLYALIFVHACVLMLGGHYTYARVPLGDWMREWFGLSRNPYDGIGHFMQGFVPAIAARELLLRHTGLQRGAWLFIVVTAVCLAISAIYELIEWAAAVALGQGADAFLGTQGDPWDTQKDMLWAWIGAMVAQGLLARWHDRQLGMLARNGRR
jgi:putative membrane protein